LQHPNLKLGKLDFIEDGHKYKFHVTQIAPPTKLQSATTFNKHFFAPFKKYEVARGCALKEGKTVEEILADWDFASYRGTTVHALIETYIKTGVEPDLNHQFRAYFDVFLKFKADSPHLVNWESEVRLTVAQLGICGTVDLIAYDTRLKGYVIVDWKCTGDIEDVSSPEERWKKWAKEPFDEYEDCKKVLYSLQLAVYSFMAENYYYERYGYIQDAYLVHIKRDLSGYEIIRGIDLRRELMKALRYRVAVTDDMHEDHVILARMCPAAVWTSPAPGVYWAKCKTKRCRITVKEESATVEFGGSTRLFEFDIKNQGFQRATEWLMRQ